MFLIRSPCCLYNNPVASIFLSPRWLLSGTTSLTDKRLNNYPQINSTEHKSKERIAPLHIAQLLHQRLIDVIHPAPDRNSNSPRNKGGGNARVTLIANKEARSL